MSTLAGRLHEIRMKTGGARESRGWVMGTGVSQEVRYKYTGLNPQGRRILAQLGFALCLPDAEKARYAKEMETALGILEKSLESQNVLSADACKAAEEAILPLQKTAKEYTILFAAHAHIDMNWLWSWQETVQTSLATFRTMLALMDEYPEFTFSQSQASCYKLVEEYDLEMMEEIKKRIKEGRWEVTASAWVETDKNMPCTESLLRHIRYTKNYLSSVWGLDPSSLTIDFSPDTFGHNANIPEIDSYGGVKYMYHCRALNERQVLYRWRSPSGAEILSCCEPYWYNRGIQDEIAFGAPELASLCGGLKTSLIVYGVGNHGGGPTRRDVERILEMREWPVYPTVRFGNFAEFFKAAETVRDKLPIVDKEINFIYTGCYTTQSRIKLGNRRTEAALLDAEFLNSMSAVLAGKQYPPAILEQAWQKTLFNHFHDIITGSCVRDTRDYAMANFSKALAAAGTAREKAGIALASLIDTSMFNAPANSDNMDERGNRAEGAGAGFGLKNFGGIPNPARGKGSTRIFHVFNPSAQKRREAVEFVLWDWDYDLERAELRNHENKIIPLQLMDKEPLPFWGHRYIRFTAFLEIPAGGYVTLALREAEFGEAQPLGFNPFPRADVIHGPIILENEILRAEFDSAAGVLVSLKEKKTGKEIIAAGKSAGLVINWAEKSTNDAWKIGRYLAEDAVRGAVQIIPKTGNPLRNGFEMEQLVLGSKIKTSVFLDAEAKALAYEFNIDWNEAAKDHKNVPVLCFVLPLGTTPEYFQSDIPGGIQKRPSAFHDIPGLQYTAAVNGGTAAALITDCKYGYRGCGQTLYATLINSSSSPDPYPERGEHTIKLAVALEESAPKALYEAAFNFCHPVSIVSGNVHSGSLPPAAELLRLDCSSTVLSSVGMDSNGELLVRFYENAGKNDEVVLTAPLKIESAVFVDLDGKCQTGNITPEGKTLRFKMLPYKIQGLKLKLKPGS